MMKKQLFTLILLPLLALSLAACDKPEPAEPPEAMAEPSADPGAMAAQGEPTTNYGEPIEQNLQEEPAEEPTTDQPAPDGKDHRLSGTASWYGKDFHGKETACGATFDKMGMTAAHNTLPFNTRVRVRSKETGEAIEVVINDRGPNKNGHVIDVTRGVAEKLGWKDDGTHPVDLEVVEWGEGETCKGT